MARPTKYNEARAKEICDRLRAGSTRTAAAESVGIDYDTFRKWLNSKSEFFVAVTHAEAECEVTYTAIVKKAAGGWDSGTTTRTTKTVFKTKKTRHADGTVIEEPVMMNEVTETVTAAREFDWRAALEWLKRRRRIDWGDSLDIRKLDDETLLRLLGVAEGSAETRLIAE